MIQTLVTEVVNFFKLLSLPFFLHDVKGTKGDSGKGAASTQNTFSNLRSKTARTNKELKCCHKESIVEFEADTAVSRDIVREMRPIIRDITEKVEWEVVFFSFLEKIHVHSEEKKENHLLLHCGEIL